MDTYFSKNKYHLKNPSYSYNKKSLQECKNLTIQNKKAGFEYTGNNNKCILYSSNIPNTKIDKDVINDFNISKYIKLRNQKDASFKQQTDPNFYFNKTNHYNLDNKYKIKSYNLQNLEQCQKKCLDNSNCKNIYYYQQPQSCTLYDSIQFGKFHKFPKKDIYSVNYKKLNQHSTLTEEEEKMNISIKNNNKYHQDKKIFGSKYTSCFSNDDYNDFNKMQNSYNKICASQFGSEYKFVNNDNDQNIVDCSNKNQVKIRCVPQFIEHYQNKKYIPQYYLFFFLFLIIIIVYYFLTKIKK
jgi:hypothetical protein